MGLKTQERATSALGSRLRALRAEKGLKITDVAKLTGLAVSTISKVENGRMSLTYDKLLQVAHGLSLDLTDFLNAPAVADKAAAPVVMGRRSVSRADDGFHIAAGFYDYWYLNTDLARKAIIPIIGETSAHSIDEFGDLISHSGEEFIFILEGSMIVHTQFYSPIRLTVGESLYIDSMMGHAYIAADCEKCRFLSVCTEDGRDLHDLETPVAKPPVRKRRAS